MAMVLMSVNVRILHGLHIRMYHIQMLQNKRTADMEYRHLLPTEYSSGL